jgi:hypothetical protein
MHCCYFSSQVFFKLIKYPEETHKHAFLFNLYLLSSRPARGPAILPQQQLLDPVPLPRKAVPLRRLLPRECRRRLLQPRAKRHQPGLVHREGT